MPDFIAGTTVPETTTATQAPDDVSGTQGALNPIDDAAAFDTMLLANEPNPGIVTEIAGATNPRKWDERAGTGQSGATLVYSGDGLAKFSVKLLLWKGDHFAEWESWKRLLVPPTEKNPQALDIYHPYLEMLPVPIRSVVIDEPAAPVQKGDGFWEVEIKFRQYRAPKPAGAKANGSKSGGQKSTDPVDQMINDLTKTVQDLAK